MGDRADSSASKGRISFPPGKASQIHDLPFAIGANAPTVDTLTYAVHATITAYLQAARDLGSGKYSHVIAALPAHLAEPATAVALLCTDGVIVRYERPEGQRPVRALQIAQGISEVVPGASEYVLYCSRTADEPIEFKDAVRFQLGKREATKRTPLSESIPYRFVTSLDSSAPVMSSVMPYRLITLNNRLEVFVEGKTLPPPEDVRGEQHFIVRTEFTVPVGWECIEVFPGVDPTNWRAEHAGAWAEQDILSAMVIYNARRSFLDSLDPRAAARYQYLRLFNEFRALLDSDPEREEELHIFLKAHPELLCPTASRMWSKLALGKHITDFVFRDAPGEYLLVEIERSTHRLFRENGHPLDALNKALNQISDWRRYIAENLDTVRRELGLVEIPSQPPALIVIGRRQRLGPEGARQIRVVETERERLRLMTYDDVYDNAKQAVENLLGPLWEPAPGTELMFPR